MVRDLATFVRENRGDDFVSKRRALRYEIADRAIESEVEQMLCTQVDLDAEPRARARTRSRRSPSSSRRSSTSASPPPAMHMLGAYGQLRRGSEHVQFNGRAESAYLYATTSTVGGGTSRDPAQHHRSARPGDAACVIVAGHRSKVAGSRQIRSAGDKRRTWIRATRGVSTSVRARSSHTRHSWLRSLRLRAVRIGEPDATSVQINPCEYRRRSRRSAIRRSDFCNFLTIALGSTNEM